MNGNESRNEEQLDQRQAAYSLRRSSNAGAIIELRRGFYTYSDTTEVNDLTFSVPRGCAYTHFQF